jgi:hypothetical protein
MPWSRGKQVARALRGEDKFPANYRGSRTVDELTALFNACFRIQREACEAAGRHIPLIVENVRGAIPWVGRSRWNFGSFHLWGDVPALMPATLRARKFNPDRIDHSTKNNGESWFAIGSPGQKVTGQNPVHELARQKVPGFRFDGSGRSFQSAAVAAEGYKTIGMNWSDRSKTGQDFTRIAGKQAGEGRKAPGGTQWFNDGPRTPDSLASSSSKSPRRKAASAMIAKIPFPLSQHIARVFKPR